MYVNAGQLKCQCSNHRGNSCPFISKVKCAMSNSESDPLLAEMRANLLDEGSTTAIKERTSVSWKSIPIAVQS